MIALMIAAVVSNIPPALVPPPNATLALSLRGRGVQIYVCEARDTPGQFGWRLSAPQATLLDAEGHAAGRHFAGPTWQAVDGSQVVGQARAKVASPDPSAVDWLLLSAKAASGPGVFGRVTYVQRLNTQGGQPPAAGCDGTSLGNQVRKPYSAEYDFYTGS